jgi:thiol-disulfide isomerase/thioredoxin
MATSALGQDATKLTAVPVVTVEPACPEWTRPADRSQHSLPPHITVHYNPNVPGARLVSAQSVTLFLASVEPSPSETMTLPLIRSADGTWQAEFDAKPDYLLMFFFKDQQNRIDNNRGEYWDIPLCIGGEPDPQSVLERASTYDGHLIAPGIQRAPNLARAVEILKDELKRRPDDYLQYFWLWHDELKIGGETDSAYGQVSREVDAFITAHGTEPDALFQISGFIGPEQQKVEPNVVERYRKALIALPQSAEAIQRSRIGVVNHISRERFVALMQPAVTGELGELDYWPASWEKDPGRRAAALLAFAAHYPESYRAGEAYAEAFGSEREINNVAGMEAVFDKWAAFDPENPDPLAVMAHFYIDRKMKLDRAVQMLDAALPLFAKARSGRPKSIMSVEVMAGSPRDKGKIEFLRGQANLLLNNLPAARADLETAAKAMPDKPDVLYLLGQSREKMGATTEALDAYLAAASAPYQDSAAPREAYERLFVAQKLGTQEDADQKLFARISANAHSAAAQYVPIPLDRPAPKFTFTDLAGNTFDNEAAQGKPTILSFWSVWCGPCVPELPLLEDFHRAHPNVNLLTVAIHNKPEDVKATLSSRKLNTLPVALRNDWPQDFGVNQVPTTIVIDRLGHIQFVHVGQLSDLVAILDKDLDALGTPR